MDFADWLQRELNKREWSHAELARRSGVQTSQISRVINRSRRAGPDLCIAIAGGLELPREEVFRARGWLEYLPETSELKLSPETVRVAVHIESLSPPLRRAVLKTAQAAADALLEEVGE